MRRGAWRCDAVVPRGDIRVGVAPGVVIGISIGVSDSDHVRELKPVGVEPLGKFVDETCQY